MNPERRRNIDRPTPEALSYHHRMQQLYNALPNSSLFERDIVLGTPGVVEQELTVMGTREGSLDQTRVLEDLAQLLTIAVEGMNTITPSFGQNIFDTVTYYTIPGVHRETPPKDEIEFFYDILDMNKFTSGGIFHPSRAKDLERRAYVRVQADDQLYLTGLEASRIEIRPDPKLVVWQQAYKEKHGVEL